MEKILRIEEATFKLDGKNYPSYDGYLIVTDKQTIKFGIENDQLCCESWGYLVTNDNTDEFIGASVQSIDVVDTALNKEKIPTIYEGDVMFVNIETNKGTLQFTAYNDHNGYYGHDAVIVSKQLTCVECL